MGWAFLQLLDLEAVEELQREADHLRVASLLGTAVHEPRKLRDEARTLERRARELFAPDDDRSAAARTALQRQLALIAQGPLSGDDRD